MYRLSTVYMIYRVFRTISRGFFFLPQWRVDLYSGATYMPTNSPACLLTSVGNHWAADWWLCTSGLGWQNRAMHYAGADQITVGGWGIWPAQRCQVCTNRAIVLGGGGRGCSRAGINERCDEIPSWMQPGMDWHDHTLLPVKATGRRGEGKLAGSTWGASANTLRSSALVLCYSAAEYCAPVWSRSAHTSQVNSHLVCDPIIRQPGFDLPRQQSGLGYCIAQHSCFTVVSPVFTKHIVIECYHVTMFDCSCWRQVLSCSHSWMHFLSLM